MPSGDVPIWLFSITVPVESKTSIANPPALPWLFQVPVHDAVAFGEGGTAEPVVGRQDGAGPRHEPDAVERVAHDDIVVRLDDLDSVADISLPGVGPSDQVGRRVVDFDTACDVPLDAVARAAGNLELRVV